MSTESASNAPQPPANNSPSTQPKPGQPINRPTGKAGGTTHLRPRPLKLRVNSWLRWLHIYISMASLLVILFFALSGITLNHPEWTFGTKESKREISGQLPTQWKKGETVDWFTVDEYLRQKEGLHGTVTDKRSDSGEASISFQGPGYNADCFIEPRSGKYQMTVTTQGWVGIVNDLHRGHEAGKAWPLLIDAAGSFLALLSLTGFGLLLYLKKVRVAALLTLAAGSLIFFILIKLAT